MVLRYRSRYRVVGVTLLFLSVIAVFWNFLPSSGSSWTALGFPNSQHDVDETERVLLSIADAAREFAESPVAATRFGEMGRRVETMRGWISSQETLLGYLRGAKKEFVAAQINSAVSTSFSFIRRPSGSPDSMPFARLRSNVERRPRGIVIPTGRGTFRFACHLVSALRNVLSSELPIQIVYAGEEDLPAEYRYVITRLGARIETLDILRVFDDTTLGLAKGGSAINAFAALASPFQEVILTTPDAVFLQKPEVILDNHPGYAATGTLLFHDRSLLQAAVRERHKWWEDQMKGRIPSATLNKSKAYDESYAEECDSGVVALNKSRLPILMGLLHICWQNTRSVREWLTSTMGYGHKMSWWIGLELSGANYTFENHYGAILGITQGTGGKTVCGSTVAHLDAKDKLLWYSGSLLKNKAVNQTEFLVPSHWMADAVWEKSGSESEMSCMRDGVIRDVTPEERIILSRSVDAAKAIDERFEDLIDRAIANA